MIASGLPGNITVSVRRDVEEELSKKPEQKLQLKIMEEFVKENQPEQMLVRTVEVKKHRLTVFVVWGTF